MSPFLDALRALAQTGERFVVVGGVAAVMQGAHRATYDLDLVVELTPAACTRVVDALLALGYRPQVPVDPHDFAKEDVREAWANERNMVVLSFWDTSERRAVVDLFVRYPMDFEQLWGNVVRVPVGEVTVPIASAADLIAMKRAVGREKDLQDVAALEEALRRE